MSNPAILFPNPAARTASGQLIDGACVTQQERDWAEEKCQAQNIRGIGANGGVIYGNWQPTEYGYPYDDTRWADMSPCAVADLPLCPCANDWDVMAITPCIAGTDGPASWSDEFFHNWCAQRGAGLLTSDYCWGNTLPPLPSCLDQGARQGLSYCQQYGFGGPNAYANALCWNVIQSGRLPTLLGMPDCGSGYTAPPQQDNIPQDPFFPPPPPEVTPPPPATTERSSMMLPGLILLLVAGAGAAYYVAQRKQKR